MRPAWVIALVAAGMALGGAGLVSAQQDATPAPPEPAPLATAPQPAAPPGAPPADVMKGMVAPPAAPIDSAGAEPGGAAASGAPAAPPPKPAAPMQRPRFAVAVLQALDKVSAETIRFEAPVDQPIRYKSLVFIVRACETTAPDEADRDAIAHVEIDSAPLPQPGVVQPPARRLFRGWMYANAPGLHLFENPAYDAWLVACKTAAPST